MSAPGPWPGEPSAGGRAAAVPGTPGTVPAPPATAFHLTWPHARAAEVVEAWQHWAPEAPDEMAASLLLIAPGDVEEPPVANVFGSMLGTESDARELLDEVVARVGTDPASASLRPASYRDTKRYLAELGDAMAGEDDRLGEGTDEQQVHLYSKSGFFRRPRPFCRTRSTSASEGRHVAAPADEVAHILTLNLLTTTRLTFMKHSPM